MLQLISGKTRQQNLNHSGGKNFWKKLLFVLFLQVCLFVCFSKQFFNSFYNFGLEMAAAPEFFVDDFFPDEVPGIPGFRRLRESTNEVRVLKQMSPEV